MNDEQQTTPKFPSAPYVWRSKQVHQVELEYYLKKRRALNDIPEEATPENLTGLCISGGGVRSATLGLGMLQAFIKSGKLKFFDYMSTVSGGGYIGACLSSLMSAEPLRRDKVDGNAGGQPINNANTKFDVGEIGLEEHSSLFTNEQYEYPPISSGKINTKHQLNHLRQHGEYLTPHKSIKDWDVHRLIGALIGGTVSNFTAFFLLLTVLVMMHHVLLAWMSGDRFIDTLQDPTATVNEFLMKRHEKAVDQSQAVGGAAIPPIDSGHLYVSLKDAYPDASWGKLSATAQLGAWVNHSLAPQLALVWLGVVDNWVIPLRFFALGLVSALFFIFWSRKYPYKIAFQEQQEQNYAGSKTDGLKYNRKGEETVLDKTEQSFIKPFYYFGLLTVPLIAYIVTATMNSSSGGSFNYFIMLALPLCFSVGLFLGLHFFIFFYFINSGGERVSGWIYRSFYTGMQGGALLMLLVTLAFPLAILLLFGKHGMAVKLSFSFVPVTIAYYFTIRTMGARAGGAGFFSTVMHRIQTPLLNLSIFLFVGLTFAWISKGLIALEVFLHKVWCPQFPFLQDWTRIEVVIAVFWIALALLLFNGFVVSANDVSLHYFYRDRLSEAFLRTHGRMETKVTDVSGEVGRKLVHLNLRNHEDLQLRYLGEGNGRGPYHLIVAAINLQGSHDLSAKTMKSQHMLFSKYFIGSRATGYANTNLYYHGKTKLSTAMAISGAAVSSGMGSLSFAASNFYLTLFNLRTGYWLDNPKCFIWQHEMRARRQKVKERSKNSISPEEAKIGWTIFDNLKLWWSIQLQKHPFWLNYIWQELTGNLNAHTPKVNVSDGGHTGDNLGLLPLIQRQCSTIVVADFEADGTYSFDSFGQAVRLAKSIYNADINIDLSKLMPQKQDSGEVFSPDSVAVGTITYHIPKKSVHPETGEKIVALQKKTGQIVYMKSSINLLKEAGGNRSEGTPPLISEVAPVMVLNYFKKNPQFPHQPTADQYFDEVQFEAYRALGEHIGRQAAARVQFGALQ